MNLRFSLVAAAALLLPAAIFSQTVDSYLNGSASQFDDAFQVNFVTGLDIGDAVVNITNAGTSALSNVPIGNGTIGDICVNIYVYFSDQELAACCSCIVTPNALLSFSFITTSHALFPTGLPIGPVGVPNTSYAIKLLATHASDGTSSGLCVDPSFGSRNTGNPVTTLPAADTLAPGMTAWITHWHSGPSGPGSSAVSETAFILKGLSAGELGKLTRDCGLKWANSILSFCPGCIRGGSAAPTPSL